MEIIQQINVIQSSCLFESGGNHSTLARWLTPLKVFFSSRVKQHFHDLSLHYEAMIQSFIAADSLMKACVPQPCGALMVIIVRLALLRGVKGDCGYSRSEDTDVTPFLHSANDSSPMRPVCIQNPNWAAGWEHADCLARTNKQRTGIIRGERPRSSLSHSFCRYTSLLSCLLCLFRPSLGAGLNVTEGLARWGLYRGHSHRLKRRWDDFAWTIRVKPRRQRFSDCGYFSVKILELKAKETRNWREVKKQIFSFLDSNHN